MQLLISKNYRYYRELKYILENLYIKFGNDLKINHVSSSNSHMSLPAKIESKFIPRNFSVQIIVDSGKLNAIVKSDNGEIALHRYLLNKNKYFSKKHVPNLSIDNSNYIDEFISELYKMLNNNNLYFYSWENNKRYKVTGNIRKKLKVGEY